MALTAPSECLPPGAEETCAQHPEHAHGARHPIIPIGPREYPLEPCPTLPDGPGHPCPQGRFELLPLLAEPLGDCLAPDRQLTRPRLAAYGRQAEQVAGLRLALTTSLASFACPTPALNAARLVRGQCEVKPVAAVPQGAQKLLGGGFVLAADEEIVPVAHDDDVAPCGLAAPWRRPEVKDRVPGQVCQERAGLSPYKVANFFFRDRYHSDMDRSETQY